MAPRLIGVPVAVTPGLVPHDEVLTAPPLELLLPAGVAGPLALEEDEPPVAVLLVLEPELHPASTPPTARTEAMTAPVRHLRLWVCCIILCLLVAFTKDDSERPGACLSRLARGKARARRRARRDGVGQ
jgi:hypothetical protein